jgi:hypothetical protein
LGAAGVEEDDKKHRDQVEVAAGEGKGRARRRKAEEVGRRMEYMPSMAMAVLEK